MLMTLDGKQLQQLAEMFDPDETQSSEGENVKSAGRVECRDMSCNEELEEKESNPIEERPIFEDNENRKVKLEYIEESDHQEERTVERSQ